MFPWKEISCKVRKNDQEKKNQTEQPVDLPDTSLRSGQKYPEKMKKSDQQHEYTTPVMNVPDELPEKYLVLQKQY